MGGHQASCNWGVAPFTTLYQDAWRERLPCWICSDETWIVQSFHHRVFSVHSVYCSVIEGKTNWSMLLYWSNRKNGNPVSQVVGTKFNRWIMFFVALCKYSIHHLYTVVAPYRSCAIIISLLIYSRIFSLKTILIICYFWTMNGNKKSSAGMLRPSGHQNFEGVGPPVPATKMPCRQRNLLLTLS